MAGLQVEEGSGTFFKCSPGEDKDKQDQRKENPSLWNF